MRLLNRLLTTCGAVLLLGLIAGAAHANSTGACPPPGSQDDVFNLGEVTSGNGQLVFSNFRFHSPSCSVEPDDLTITILQDGVEIAGPITKMDGDWAKFYVSYQVTAVEPLINGASQELASSIDSPNAVVVATKRVIGGPPDKLNGHGWGHLGWGLFKDLGSHDEPTGKTLAFLRTAEWDVDAGVFCELGPGWLCNGEFRYDEWSFEPQESIKVIDGVWIKAIDGGSDVTFTWSTNRYTVVPEPATGAMLAIGLLGLAIGGHRF